ncbi:hypothetical protein DB313_05455 (plasmid) [Borrelia turcica IST7]|uniref:Uncharacterized protein n=1 Tax=Borrelia turcica IST7 TaxID=1104446 RepID=A0A386PN64_9SPIR|nr:hypothetical protein DB313_05455 [Borrelia turcica IST7]
MSNVGDCTMNIKSMTIRPGDLLKKLK